MFLGVAAASVVGFVHGTDRPPLVFGIYPGPTVGTVGPAVPTSPSNPQRELSALEQLRGTDSDFVIRLYAGYGGGSSLATFRQTTLPEMRRYWLAGFKLELVLTYQPAQALGASAVPGFVSFVQGVVQSVGPERSVVALQVTNEANVTSDTSSSDGSSPGVLQALAEGVIAAKKETRAHGFRQLKIGFTWAYARGSDATAFWRELSAVSGSALADATDWVGIDLYPGTWGPALPPGDLRAAIRKWTVSALRSLRDVDLKAAGFRAGLAVHITESGYPTGPQPGRSDAVQVEVESALIRAINSVREAYHVTDYRWFDLRDADSSYGDIEAQYGLLRDDYTPKPGFLTYRRLIQQLSGSRTG